MELNEKEIKVLTDIVKEFFETVRTTDSSKYYLCCRVYKCSSNGLVVLDTISNEEYDLLNKILKEK